MVKWLIWVNSRLSSPLAGWYVAVCFLSCCYSVPGLSSFHWVSDVLLSVHIKLALLYPPLLFFKVLFTVFPVHNTVMMWGKLISLVQTLSTPEFFPMPGESTACFHTHWIHSSFPQPHTVSLTCPFITLGTLKQCHDETPGFSLQLDIHNLCPHVLNDHEHQLLPSAS